jgi:carboxyl-terminal processing protease
MNTLILDLRNNGGGLMNQAVKMLDLFIDSNDTILYTQGRINDANEVFYAYKNKYDKKFPIIVLINRASASASEIIAGGLQDLDRGIIVGETSFGKGLEQRQFRLDDGSAARITVAKYYTPSGRLIQRDFDDGIDTYYKNLLEENRELNDTNKIAQPTYKTKKGRTVYGGGGITPDLKTDSNKYSIYKRTIFIRICF